MKKVVTVSLLLVLMLTAVLSSGCATTTNIGDIKANPSQYKGEEVTVKGTVGNSFWLALLSKGAYEISDDTGSIWVVCEHTPPEKNDEVKIKGTVEEAIRVGEHTLGTVIIEKVALRG